MAHKAGDALFAQALHIGIVRRIRALNGIAEFREHLGNAGHADAADADEMDRAGFARDFRGSHGNSLFAGIRGTLERGRRSAGESAHENARFLPYQPFARLESTENTCPARRDAASEMPMLLAFAAIS